MSRMMIRIVLFTLVAVCWILWGFMWWIVRDAFINGSVTAGIVASVITLMVSLGPIVVSMVAFETA